MSVVIFESSMTTRAFLNPESRAAISVLPERNSSFILSYIRILPSTAIPIVRITPPIPGRVSVDLRNIKLAMTRSMATARAMSAATPRIP